MNVLLIEDNTSILKVVERTLSSYGYSVHTQTPYPNLKHKLPATPNKLFILNTNLEQCDSQNLCQTLREQKSNCYIIGINSKGNWKDRIEFLKNGADDCLNYPFPMNELLARIQVVLRRPKNSKQTQLRYGDIKISPLDKKAYFNDRSLDLTKKEYSLLEYMVRNNERPLTRTELLDHVWDYKKIVTSNTVDVHVQKLRSKFREAHQTEKQEDDNNSVRDSNNGYFDKTENMSPRTKIKTIHGIGYKLDTIDPDNSEKNQLEEL